MKKAFIFLLALTAALAVFTACEGSAAANGPGGEPGSARDSEIPAEAPTAEPTAVPTEPPSQVIEMLEVRRQCIVNDPEVGTVYISPDGDMFAIDGENKDGIFGNADCESYGDPGVCFIKAGSTPALLDTGVEKACMLFYSRREYKYDGEYGESLIYLKNDGTVWLRGSNIKGIFGSFDKATEPVKLLDGAVNIGSDGRSIAAGMEDGSILAWDMTVDNGGKPILIAEHADVSCLAGAYVYMTEEGELFARDVTVNGASDFASFGKDVIRFGRNGESSFWKLDKKGLLTLFSHFEGSGLTEIVLEENVVYACSADKGEGICCINASGQFKAYMSAGKLQAQMSNAAYGGVENTYCWAVTSDNMLFTNNSGGLKKVADNVAYAVPGVVKGSVLYVTLDGRLFSLNWCSPEGYPAEEPFEIVLP